MKIVQHISLLLFLLFMSWFFWFKVHAAPLTLTWSTTEKDIEKQSEVIISIDTEENIPLDSEEKLSFDTEEVSEENLELNSAEDIDDADKTIKELEEEKDQLITEKIIVTDNFNAFILNNWDLRKFFKLELTSGELSVIEAIITSYNSQRHKWEGLLKDTAHQLEDTDVATTDLLDLKKNLYISFLPFIQISLLEEYKIFIKADAEATKKDKIIQSDIYKKEKIVEEKKTVIQEKIEASEQDLEIKKNQIIEEKINQKLTAYAESEKFSTLDLQTKKIVFTAVLDKIAQRRIELEVSEEWNENLEETKEWKKIKLYIIVESALDIFIQDLK